MDTNESQDQNRRSMTVMEPRIYGDYDDFYRDDVLYDHFLKKFRKKIKKRGLFKSIVRLGAPSLMLKKKLLKKKRSQPKEEKAPPKTKAKMVKLGIKSATSASTAGPAMELVRPTPQRNREVQATMLSLEANLDSQPEQEDNLPADNKKTQYILIGAAVGAIALVVMVRRKRNMQ